VIGLLNRTSSGHTRSDSRGLRSRWQELTPANYLNERGGEAAVAAATFLTYCRGGQVRDAMGVQHSFEIDTHQSKHIWQIFGRVPICTLEYVYCSCRSDAQERHCGLMRDWSCEGQNSLSRHAATHTRPNGKKLLERDAIQ
jgi:hypothetical protein